MRNGRMTQRGAILIAGALGAVILIMLFPLWRTMAWSSQEEKPKTAAASGVAVAEVVSSGVVISGGVTSGGAVSGDVAELIQPEGMTLESRIQTPAGYERTEVDSNSLAAFMRTYPMKKNGAKVKLFNGQPAENQTAHAAVFKLPLERTNLQQSTSSVQRVVAEYLWKQEKYDQISFQFGNGFKADYIRWREGYRISHTASGTVWVEQGAYDVSYENFQKYLQAVFLKTSSATLEKESEKTTLSKLKAGDVFVKSGTGGHVVMIVDVCENAEGKKAFLLAQGGAPAQQFHVIKNPAHEKDPWYYEEEIKYPFETPGCKFPKGSLRSLEY